MFLVGRESVNIFGEVLILFIVLFVSLYYVCYAMQLLETLFLPTGQEPRCDWTLHRTGVACSIREGERRCGHRLSCATQRGSGTSPSSADGLRSHEGTFEPG